MYKQPFHLRPFPFRILSLLKSARRYITADLIPAWLTGIFTLALVIATLQLGKIASKQTEILSHTDTRLGQPDGISPSRMAEMLEVDKAGSKVRC